MTRVLGNPCGVAFLRRISGVVTKVLGYQVWRGRYALATARKICRLELNSGIN